MAVTVKMQRSRGQAEDQQDGRARAGRWNPGAALLMLKGAAVNRRHWVAGGAVP